MCRCKSGELHDKSVGLDAQERSKVMENMIANALQEDLPVSRRHRRLVLVSAQELVSSHNQVEPTAVDSPADSPSVSGILPV